MSDCKHGGKDVPSATDAVRALVERYEKRIEKLEQLVRDWAAAPCAECDPWGEHFACDYFDGHDCMLGVRMTELGLGD